MNQDKIGVLFVCLGNICRSPIAEGAFRNHVEARRLNERFHIDSAGTSGYHVGELPDSRSIDVAQRHGVDLSDQRSRKLVAKDLSHFDYVIAMDSSNLSNINKLKPGSETVYTDLLLDASRGGPQEVPDPYYGGPGGFDTVWDMVDRGCARLLDQILADHT